MPTWSGHNHGICRYCTWKKFTYADKKWQLVLLTSLSWCHQHQKQQQQAIDQLSGRRSKLNASMAATARSDSVMQSFNDHCYRYRFLWILKREPAYLWKTGCFEIYCVPTSLILMFKIGGLCIGIIATAGVWFGNIASKVSIIQTEGRAFFRRNLK